MEADWEIEVGGGAPVIEAHWSGFVDLRAQPGRIVEISEVAKCAPLAELLLALNGTVSGLWTAKCDLWEPDAPVVAGETSLPDAELRCGAFGSPHALACYVDLLPLNGRVFPLWTEAESFCRAWVDRLAEVSIPEARLDLVVRQAIAGTSEGFGVTAYFHAEAGSGAAAISSLAAAFSAFAASIPPLPAPADAVSRIQ
jgi:hypothetical protein